VRIALFITCVGDTLFPEAGRATVEVLERLGHEVVFPRGQTCCGQLHVNSGYRAEGLALARRFARVFGGFEAVVAPSSSCVGNVREVVPQLAREAGDDAFAAEAEDLGTRVSQEITAAISGQETVAQALSKSQGYAVPVGQAQP